MRHLSGQGHSHRDASADLAQALSSFELDVGAVAWSLASCHGLGGLPSARVPYRRPEVWHSRSDGHIHGRPRKCQREGGAAYDFGDSWEHRIAVEKVLRPDPGLVYPVCTDGKLHCPPEDCGGIGGFYDLLEAVADPAHDQHEELLEWIGDSFDPASFSPAAVPGSKGETRVVRRVGAPRLSF